MLNLQYFDYLIQRPDSLEKTLMLEKTEGRRQRGQWRLRWLDGIIDSIDEFEQAPVDSDGREDWPAAAHGVEKSRTQLSG